MGLFVTMELLWSTEKRFRVSTDRAKESTPPSAFLLKCMRDRLAGSSSARGRNPRSQNPASFESGVFVCLSVLWT